MKYLDPLQIAARSIVAACKVQSLVVPSTELAFWLFFGYVLQILAGSLVFRRRPVRSGSSRHSQSLHTLSRIGGVVKVMVLVWVLYIHIYTYMYV